MEKVNNDIKEKKKNVFYIGLLSFFGGISQDIFSPILPIYLTSFLGFDKAFVGIAEGVVTASSYIFKVVAGIFSDKFKKQKPIVFAGYFLSMISRPLLAFLTSGAAIIGLRLLDGIGKGTKDPAKDVLVAGSSDKNVRGKNFGIARMLDTLGSVAGPLILFGLLYLFKDNNFVYHYILLFAAVPLIITLVLILTKVKETAVQNESVIEFNKKEISEKKLPKSFFVFLIIIIIFTLGNSSDAFLILRAKNLGATLLEIPIIIAFFNLIYALAAVPFGSLSDKIGRIPTMLIGWITFAIVYFGFAMTTHVAIVWLLYGLYGIYYATNEGIARALLTDIVEPGHRGRAFGIYGTTIGLATIPASFLAGFLWDKFGPQVPFYFGSIMAMFAAICLFIFSKKMKVI